MKKYGPVILTVILLVSWGFSRHNAEGGIKRRSVELTFWHSMSIYQGDTLEQLIEEYNNNNEDIQVRLIFQGLYDDMKIKLINAVKTGDLPDVSQVAIEYLDVFIDDRRIEPITDYISEDDKNDILSQFWNGVTRQREI
ncbi:MAG: hypothetical protein KAR18_05050, partial [Spirochaetes bacterium]|nr:hypothetical protein [Spirochaetota bacterium]